MSKDCIKFMKMEVFTAANIAVGFKVINADGFPEHMHSLTITNTMDKSVIISFDGLYGHEYIPSYKTINILAQACCSVANRKSLFKNKSKVYVRREGNLPKGGSVILMGFYQEHPEGD